MSSFFISADPESVGGDTLTCGVCKKEFALADIVKFIQHKVLTCNKENYSNCNTEGKKTSAENGSDSVEVSETTTTTTLTTTTLSTNPAASTAASATLTGRRHSISTTTPVTEVKSLVTAAAAAAGGSTTGQTGVDNNNLPSQLVKTELESRRNKVECVDAESNTVNSGKALIFRWLPGIYYDQSRSAWRHYCAA